jgi:orotidine-5'-phosphate decarboxylase
VANYDPGSRLITAIDVPDAEHASRLLATLGDAADWVKLGLELFLAEGPALVRSWVADGRRVMLDLKLHDIPKTVERAVARVAALGPELLTVHAGGGSDMLSAAAGAAGNTRILGVTVLTSMDDTDLASLGATGTVIDNVLRRAELVARAGCAGVVASAAEAADIRDRFGDDLLIVTPGVRPAGTDVGDQKRVVTPKKARENGADLVVVGRPIRDADDPRAAALAIREDLR